MATDIDRLELANDARFREQLFQTLRPAIGEIVELDSVTDRHKVSVGGEAGSQEALLFYVKGHAYDEEDQVVCLFFSEDLNDGVIVGSLEASGQRAAPSSGTTSTPGYAFEGDPDTGLHHDSFSNKLTLVADGDEGIQVDRNSTAAETRLLVWDIDNGALARVSVGADDSGGSGYKVLRVAN